MMKKIIVYSLVTFCLLGLQRDLVIAQESSISFTKAERKSLRKCKGPALAIYHSKQMKEFTRLMNLARINPTLLRKYIQQKYGEIYVSDMPWKAIDKSFAKNYKQIGLLRPSFSLHVGSFYHAFGGGLKGSVGHQNFESRLIASLNFNSLQAGIASGENCEYGSHDAIDIFEGLMNSTPHRSNILNPDFMRAGMSRKYHKKYRHNTVTMFSGPKLFDWVLHNKQSHLVKN